MKKNIFILAPVAIMVISSCSVVKANSGGSSIENVPDSSRSMVSSIGENYYLSKTSLSLKVGHTVTLYVWREGYKGGPYGTGWRSDDPSIATVNSGGEVTGVGVGQTTIYVKVKGKTLSCKVTVTEENYTLSENDMIVVESESIDVPTVYASGKAVTETVTWSSLDSNVASVSGNRIFGIKEGATYIVATLYGTELRARVTVLSKAKSLFILKGQELSTGLHGFSGTQSYNSESFETLTTTSNNHSWFFYYDLGDDVFNIENAWEFEWNGQHRRAVASITFGWGEYRKAIFQSTYYRSYSSTADYNDKMKVRFNPTCITFNVSSQAISVDTSYTYTALHNDFQTMDSYDFAFMWHAVEKANEFARDCLATDSKISSYGLKLFQ